jgi:hypothetical protein
MLFPDEGAADRGEYREVGESTLGGLEIIEQP